MAASTAVSNVTSTGIRPEIVRRVGQSSRHPIVGTVVRERRFILAEVVDILQQDHPQVNEELEENFADVVVEVRDFYEYQTNASIIIMSKAI